MNKRSYLFFALLALLVVSGTAQAQRDWTVLPRAMGIGFTEELTDCADRCITVDSFAAFQAFLIAPETSQINGWEGTVSLPVDWSVTNVALNPSNALNVLASPAFIVGLGGLFNGNPHYTLVTFDLLYFAGPTPPVDSQICVGPSDPSSTPGFPNVVINNNIEQAEGMWPNRAGLDGYCSIINPSAIECPNNCTVAVESSSLGAIKARF